MFFVLVAVIAAVVLGAGGIGVFAARQKRLTARSNEVVPGVATKAPPAWAGSHTPEAKLHRRLVDAVSAVRNNPTLSDSAFGDARASIEQMALALDDRLIAAAGLPASHRQAAIAAVEPSVVSLENAVATLVAPPAVGRPEIEGRQQAIDDSLRAAQMRLQALAEARLEVDRLDRPVPDEGGTPATG